MFPVIMTSVVVALPEFLYACFVLRIHHQLLSERLVTKGYAFICSFRVGYPSASLSTYEKEFQVTHVGLSWLMPPHAALVSPE